MQIQFPSRYCQAALLLVAAFMPLKAQIYNQNLVLNGGAESGPAASSSTDAQVSNIPYWTVSGSFSVGTYGGDGFLQSGDYVPVDHGQYLFYGGPDSKPSTATQTIDLSQAGTDIDAGKVKYYLSGYLGLLFGAYDNINLINLKAEFQDASGKALLTATAAGPTIAEIHFPGGLLLRTASGFLPPNVRKAKVTVNLNVPISGNAGNGYAADNISLVLTTDPMMGVNQIVNGDGETNPQTADGKPVPGWNADSFFQVGKYGGNWMPAPTDPGPSDRGTYAFACPTGNDHCRAYQSIDFSAAAKQVDAGLVTFKLSGWFGGDTDYPDQADLSVIFYDASNNAINMGAGPAVQIGPVSQSDRKGQRELIQKAAYGIVPTGARSAQVTLEFIKLGPSTDNLDAYADDLVFQLDSTVINTVVNGASSQTGSVAPGEFVAIYGSGLGPATGALGTYSKGLGGSQVFFNGTEAFLTYASATQINALVPYGVTGKADVTVRYNGNGSNTFPLSVTDSSPAIFTMQYGPGEIVAVNLNDYTFNAAANPVSRGGWIEFFATGQGQVSPGGVDGESIPDPVGHPKNPLLGIKVSFGGVEVQPLWTGLIYTGVLQVNVQVPDNAPTGSSVPVVLTIGNTTSRKDATVAIK